MSSGPRVPIIEATSIARSFIKEIEDICNKIAIVGSIRRGKQDIGDIDILTIPKSKSLLDKKIEELADNVISGIGASWQVIFIYKGIKLNILKTTLDSWGSSLLHSTGSKEFNTKLRSRAKSQGMLLNQYGLFNGDLYLAGSSEEDIFRILKLEFIEPRSRNDDINIGDAETKIYKIASSSGNSYYTVKISDQSESCTCPHHVYRGAFCKHLKEAKLRYDKEKT